jgi:hypothetical protein
VVGSMLPGLLKMGLPSCWARKPAAAILRAGDGKILWVLGHNSGQWLTIFQRSKC